MIGLYLKAKALQLCAVEQHGVCTIGGCKITSINDAFTANVICKITKKKSILQSNFIQLCIQHNNEFHTTIFQQATPILFLFLYTSRAKMVIIISDLLRNIFLCLQSFQYLESFM